MIQDSYDDVINSPGGYGLYLDGSLVFSGYNFKNSTTHAIPSNFNFFMMKLNTDNYGGELSWEPKKDRYIVLRKEQWI